MKKLFTFMIMVFSLPALNGQMQEAVNKILTDHQLMGLSVVTVCEDRVTGSFNAGLRDFERNLPVNDSTRFRIASISKLVMTTAMMRLYDRNLFKLDDDVSTYLGFLLRNPNHPKIPITVRMLLSHTGSINEGSGYDAFLMDTYNNVANPPDFSQLLVPGGKYYTEDMWRKEAPGEYFTYCNANFGLAGTLIEKISGQRFDAFINENIFTPLGITGAYTVEGLGDLNNLAVIYRNEEDRWTPQTDNFKGGLTSPRNFSEYKIGTNAAVFSPQGGLRISASELARVMIIHLNNGKFNGERLISKRSIRLMQSPQWRYDGSNGVDDRQVRSWGLSVQILTNTPSGDIIFENTKMMGHTGDAYGLISGFWFDPKKRSGFIFITNGMFRQPTPGSRSAFDSFQESVYSAVRENAGLPCKK